MITKVRAAVEAQGDLVAWAASSVGCRLSPSRPKRSLRSTNKIIYNFLNEMTIYVLFFIYMVIQKQSLLGLSELSITWKAIFGSKHLLIFREGSYQDHISRMLILYINKIIVKVRLWSMKLYCCMYHQLTLSLNNDSINKVKPDIFCKN